MSRARIWWGAARPRTLPAAAAPVLIGTGLAHRDGALHWPTAAAALLAALLLQIGANYANDYHDFVRGADRADRLGPVRATAAGLVRPAEMQRAYRLALAAALAVGTWLVVRGGVPILAIGIASIACAILYTGGPRPLGYAGLGDLLVLVFFGPVAVAGTHWVQALQWSTTAIVAGLGPGMLAVALLAVNNLRDIETDRRAGKRTLAVRCGRAFTKTGYAVAIALAALVPAGLAWQGAVPPLCAAASVACLSAIPALRAVLRARAGDRLLDALTGTGRSLALYGVAFAAPCFVR